MPMKVSTACRSVAGALTLATATVLSKPAPGQDADSLVREAWDDATRDTGLEINALGEPPAVPLEYAISVLAPPGTCGVQATTIFAFRPRTGNAHLWRVDGDRWLCEVGAWPSVRSSRTTVDSREVDRILEGVEVLLRAEVRATKSARDPGLRREERRLPNLGLWDDTGSVRSFAALVNNMPSTSMEARVRAAQGLACSGLAALFRGSRRWNPLPSSAAVALIALPNADAVIDSIALDGDGGDVALLEAVSSTLGAANQVSSLSDRVSRARTSLQELPEGADSVAQMLLEEPVSVLTAGRRLRAHRRLALATPEAYRQLLLSMFTRDFDRASEAFRHARLGWGSSFEFAAAIGEDTDPSLVMDVAEWAHEQGDGEVARSLAEGVWRTPAWTSMAPWRDLDHPRLRALRLMRELGAPPDSMLARAEEAEPAVAEVMLREARQSGAAATGRIARVLEDALSRDDLGAQVLVIARVARSQNELGSWLTPARNVALRRTAERAAADPRASAGVRAQLRRLAASIPD